MASGEPLPAATHEQRNYDMESVTSSVEFQDAVIDDSWFYAGDYRSKKPTGVSWARKILETEAHGVGETEIVHRSFISRWLQARQDRALLKRLDKFDLDEAKTFVAQKLFKIDGIICDEQMKLMLIEKMVLFPSVKMSTEERDELRAKYGSRLTTWLKDRLVPYANDSELVLERALRDFDTLKRVDPLCNWHRLNSDVCTRMFDRIQNLAGTMASMIQYSLLLEPGSITPHLSMYAAEFHQLKTFFERNEMTSLEAAQTAFAANCMTKARNKVLECADLSRVVLRPLDKTEVASNTSYNFNVDESSHSRSLLFADTEDVPPICKSSTTYGTSDFIHASYVRGGPLLNTFICTQAPMPSTLLDFWHMVWQENSQLIIMLCSAVDDNKIGLLNTSIPNCCPYYWPKLQGDEMRCGNFIIRNERLDGTLDPLFNVTYLSLRRVDDPKDETRFIEHYQYDWKEFSDCHWPLRILRRARLSSTPTIVHCMDGCGRSGTLVTIEALLMHILRSSAKCDNLVLTTALFVRLQRRHAIASPLQYLYIYRVLLHWMQPYITSCLHRFFLGLSFPDWGFVGKYNKLVATHVRFTPS